MLKKLNFIFALVIIFGTHAFGQAEACEKFINTVLTKKSFDPQGLYYFDTIPNKERTFLLTMQVDVNERGGISVKFLNKSSKSDIVMGYDRVRNAIVEDPDNLLKQYKNTRFIVPIWAKTYRTGRQDIEIDAGFLNNFTKLIPSDFYTLKGIRGYVFNPVILHVMEVTYDRR